MLTYNKTFDHVLHLGVFIFKKAFSSQINGNVLIQFLIIQSGQEMSHFDFERQ